MEISAVNPITTATATAANSAATLPEIKAENRNLIQAVKKVNEAEVFGDNSELTFVLDRQTGRTLMRIVDKNTKEVLQQLPPDYVLRLAEQLKTR